VTDGREALDRQFAALARAGVKRAAAGALFLRPAVVESLLASVPDRTMLAPLLRAYGDGRRTGMRGSPWPIQNLPVEARREIFARVEGEAEAHGIELRVCACKNHDLARGSCNIAGSWAGRTAAVEQPLLLG
jgi:hypothetical protein